MEQKTESKAAAHEGKEQKIGIVEKLKNIVNRDIWNETPTGKKISRLPRALLRIVMMTVHGFTEQRIGLRASALTYYTILSIIPVIALAFAIAKGFGLEGIMTDMINSNMSQSPEVAAYMIQFAAGALENTRSGLVAGVGVVMLLYTVFKLLSNIEDAFNVMWCVSKPRTLLRKLTDYGCIMILTPILVIMSASITVFARTELKTYLPNGFYGITDFLISLLPFIFLWVALALLYLIAPNTKVNIRAAVVAGIITGTALQVLQWAFITFQIGVSKAGAIYGSFAFFPLLLSMLQMAWTLVLSGCRISFAVQNASRHYYMQNTTLRPSTNLERKMSLLIMQKIVDGFKAERPALSGNELANELDIPQTFFYYIAEKLKRAHILTETISEKEGVRTFVPAVDVNTITPSMICQRMDSLGDDEQFHFSRTKEFATMESIYDQMMEEGRKNCGNLPL